MSHERTMPRDLILPVHGSVCGDSSFTLWQAQPSVHADPSSVPSSMTANGTVK